MSILAALLLASDATVAPTRELIHGIDPIQLFEAACKNGSVQLSPEARQIRFRQLPGGAKVVVDRAMSDGLANPSALEFPQPKDTPNPVFQLEAKGEVFLITTTAEPVPEAALADSCMVVWKSSNFWPAYYYVLGGAKGLIPPPTRWRDFMRLDDGAHVITAATRDVWTTLKWDVSSGDPLAKYRKYLRKENRIK